ncbi:hypothetical protein A3K73_05130 [Candidatus Pacearchaeota archaeon RBG_13_36_9]|nr:MAG: hypothetical protein A3K73_05130 [Candidatus Pacearchaeota archaeon RBG_13_36_9]
MKKKWIILLIVIFLAIILSIVAFMLYKNKPIKVSEQELYYCEQDFDCIKVTAEVCGCNNGGTNTAINKNYTEYWMDQFPEIVNCIMVMSNHWTCEENAVPKCVNNRCQLGIQE